jgi:hypothetical protein
MSTLIEIPLYVVLGFWLLWVFFLAVMSLKRARDAGTLSKFAWVLGMPVLVIGLLLDLVINVLVMSVVLWEIPRELTVTARLKRHNKQSTGWRLVVAKWFEPILDPFDPSGDHI